MLWFSGEKTGKTYLQDIVSVILSILLQYSNPYFIKCYPERRQKLANKLCNHFFGPIKIKKL